MIEDETGEAAAHRLAVLGAGVMGTGIAALAIAHALPVVLIEADPSRLADAPERVAKHVRTAQLMGALPQPGQIGRLVTSTSLEAVSGSSTVIETVTESVEMKAKVLADVAAILPLGTPLITNTSSIPVDELAAALASPEVLAGTHFMNPPYLIRQVEVIRGARTSEATLAAVMSLLDVLDRQAVTVQDAPGFVTSRLLHPMINEAARIVGAGIATAADVDALMQGCLGHPVGPLRTADLIGIDNLADSLRVLAERIGNDALRPCDLLLEKVRDGSLGRKTGKGFYDYGEALA